MAIDFVIDYDCIPKQELTTEGILERLKGEERAHLIIRMFRDNGDDRPPSEMGFEFTRSTPDGEEETRLIVVQDLLDDAADLRPLQHHCQGCPANIHGRPFGCIGFIQYPISEAGEQWLLDRLPVPDDTLIWMLMRQGIREFSYNGETIRPMREDTNAYFEAQRAANRRLGEFVINANQVFEMMFGVGHISPNHAALLLLFSNAISRSIEANTLMHIAPAPSDAQIRHPFLLQQEESDDETIAALKTFLYALYTAWTLDTRLLLDV